MNGKYYCIEYENINDYIVQFIHQCYTVVILLGYEWPFKANLEVVLV